MSIELAQIDISTFSVSAGEATKDDYSSNFAVRVAPNTALDVDESLINISLNPDNDPVGNTEVVKLDDLRNVLVTANALFFKAFMQAGGQASISIPTWDTGSKDSVNLFQISDVDCDNNQVLEITFSGGDAAKVAINDLYTAINSVNEINKGS